MPESRPTRDRSIAEAYLAAKVTTLRTSPSFIGKTMRPGDEGFNVFCGCQRGWDSHTHMSCRDAAWQQKMRCYQLVND